MSSDHFCEWCRSETTRCRIPWFGKYLDLNGEPIHYVEAGKGPPLILVHGFMGWSYTWRYNLEELSRTFRVLALDLRGFGLSGKDGDRGHSIADQVQVLRDFMSALGIERADVCGHSMGGEVCLRLALTDPERIRRLILVCSSGYVVRQGRMLERVALSLPGISHLFVKAIALNRGFATRTLQAGVHDASRVQESDIEAYLLPARAPGAAGAFVSMLRDMDFGESAGLLRQVQHPTLIIWGRNDPWLPVGLGERLARDLPQSQLVVLPDCGHMPPEEYPERFNQLVSEFCSR